MDYKWRIIARMVVLFTETGNTRSSGGRSGLQHELHIRHLSHVKETVEVVTLELKGEHGLEIDF